MRDLEWLTFRDGTTGARYGVADVEEAAAGSWEMATADIDPGIAWVVDSEKESDSDSDSEGEAMVSVDAGTLAELLRLARVGAQYAGCSTCRRVTQV